MDIKHKGLDRFRKDLRDKCKKHGITLKLVDTPTIAYVENEEIQVSGYFDSENKILAVACGKDIVEWLEILIHESCHLDQYVEESELWFANDYNGIDASTILDLWLAKIVELKPKMLNEITKKIIDLERDCDMRSIDKIREYGMNDIIDIDLYTRKSNAYHLSYIAVKRLRKWNKPLKAAYQVFPVLHSFQSKMSVGYSITKKQFDLLRKHCY